ncbi:hypothetical protein Tco_0757789 [Tanacetum coccineum]
MTTMAENVIAAGADNLPPMLKKSMYNSWQSRMLLYIRGKEHGKDHLDFVLHGPFQYGIVIENGITRLRTYEELTDKEKIRDESPVPQQPYHVPVIYLPPMVPQQAYQALAVQQEPQAVFPQLDSSLVVLVFLPGDDPITSLNKASNCLSLSYNTQPTQDIFQSKKPSYYLGWQGYSAEHAGETKLEF